MTDQVNDAGSAGAPDSSREADKEKTKGDQSKADKVEVMEDVQRDAAREREENRGYQ